MPAPIDTKSLVMCWASIPAAKLSRRELHPRSVKTNFGGPRLFLRHALSINASAGRGHHGDGVADGLTGRADAQFSFPAAIAAAPPCGCSSIFNAASRPLRRLAAAFAVQRMRPDEMNLTSVDPSGYGTRMRVASSTSIAPFMVP